MLGSVNKEMGGTNMGNKKCMKNYKERDDIFEMHIPEIICDIMNRNVSA
jgi:hypothetical protein